MTVKVQVITLHDSPHTLFLGRHKYSGPANSFRQEFSRLTSDSDWPADVPGIGEGSGVLQIGEG